MCFVFGANTPEKQALFQSGWFVEGLLSQTLIVHMIRTARCRSSRVRVAAGAAHHRGDHGDRNFLSVLFAGVSVGMQPLPLSYFAWLLATLLSDPRAHSNHQGDLHPQVWKMAVTAMAAPKARINKRRRTMSRIDPARSPSNEARRWVAHALLRFASWILRGSIGLYERHRIPPDRSAHGSGDGPKSWKRSARTALFGHRLCSRPQAPQRE